MDNGDKRPLACPLMNLMFCIGAIKPAWNAGRQFTLDEGRKCLGPVGGNENVDGLMD